MEREGSARSAIVQTGKGRASAGRVRSARDLGSARLAPQESEAVRVDLTRHAAENVPREARSRSEDEALLRVLGSTGC